MENNINHQIDTNENNDFKYIDLKDVKEKKPKSCFREFMEDLLNLLIPASIIMGTIFIIIMIISM